MTMEEYFVEELKEKKEKCKRLEKRVSEMTEEKNKTEDMIREIEWLVKKANPEWTKDRKIIMDYVFLYKDEEKERALAIFARLGVDVKQEELTGEVEKK